MPKVGFSPRKSALVLYLTLGAKDYALLLKRFGKHKTGKVCLSIDKLADVDPNALSELIAEDYARMTETYG